MFPTEFVRGDLHLEIEKTVFRLPRVLNDQLHDAVVKPTFADQFNRWDAYSFFENCRGIRAYRAGYRPTAVCVVSQIGGEEFDCAVMKDWCDD